MHITSGSRPYMGSVINSRIMSSSQNLSDNRRRSARTQTAQHSTHRRSKGGRCDDVRRRRRRRRCLPERKPRRRKAAHSSRTARLVETADTPSTSGGPLPAARPSFRFAEREQLGGCAAGKRRCATRQAPGNAAAAAASSLRSIISGRVGLANRPVRVRGRRAPTRQTANSTRPDSMPNK
jgi:hypothetical protein